MNHETDLLDVAESAELLRLKESTIRSWILKRRIPYAKLGRRVFIRRADIEALISASMVQAEEKGQAAHFSVQRQSYEPIKEDFSRINTAHDERKPQ